jgi:hypothetical protein
MAITNYGQLKTAVADWLNRDDLTSVIPTFIDLAHAKLNRRLRVREMIQRSTANVTSQYTKLPGGFLSMRNIQLNVSTPKSLEFLSVEQMDQERALGNVAREPVYYTIIGDTIEVFPSPDASYEIELAYYKTLPALSADADTNWLLTKAPDSYLYGALLQAAPYLKDTAETSLWLQAHDMVVGELETDNEKALYGGSTLKARHRTF